MTAKDTLSIPQASRNSGLLDWAQMLSGVFLTLFMWAHLMLVSSALISTDLMDSIAMFFEDYYMVQVGGPLLGLLFIFHFIIAARKMPFSGREFLTFWRHASMFKHAGTWLWLVQVISAIFILVFGIIHMWIVLTSLPISAAESAVRTSQLVPLYAVLLFMVELHLGIGLYRIGVKWGVITRKSRKLSQILLTLIVSGALALGFFNIICHI